MSGLISAIQVGRGGLDAGLRVAEKVREQRKQEQEEDAFRRALQNVGDWNSVVQQVGVANPQKAFEMQQAEIKRQQELSQAQFEQDYKQKVLELQRQQLAQKDPRTTAMKDFEYYSNLTPEKQDQYLKFKKAGGTNIGLAEYDKEFQKLQAKQDIEREQAEQSRTSELEAVKRTRDELFGENGLVKKANLGYEDAEDVGGRLLGVAKRNYPTSLLSPDQQRARQQIRNVLGQLRLDKMKYLKGATSDKEQQMMADIVSGDISKYSPYEIEGTFNAIIDRLENAGKTKEPKEQEQVVDYTTYFGG